MSGWTRTPNFIYDLMPDMKEAEIKVVMTVVRETIGWQRRAVNLTVPDFERLTKLTRPSIVTGIKAALDHGIVGRQREGHSFSYWIIEPEETVKIFNSSDEVSDQPLAAVKNPNSSQDEIVKNSDSSEGETVKNLNSNGGGSVKNLNSSTVKNFNPDQKNINTTKKEREESRPVDFGNGFPRRYAQERLNGIAARYKALGLSPPEFTALVNAVLSGMNKSDIADLDTDLGQQELTGAQECALALAKKSYRSPEQVIELFESWYELDWRGEKGELPTYKLLVDHIAALPRLKASKKGAHHGTGFGRSTGNYEPPAIAGFSQAEWDNYKDPDRDEIPY